MTPIEPPAGRAVFSRTLAVEPGDVDINGHVNNIVYVRWVQDMATGHWHERIGPERSAAFAWVVLRHEIDYRRPLLPGEKALARTWVGDGKGPRFDRYVRIDGPDRQPCAQALSSWCLIDAETRRPVRVPDWIKEQLSTAD